MKKRHDFRYCGHDAESLVWGRAANLGHLNFSCRQMAKDNLECRYGAKDEKNEENNAEKEENGDLVPFGTQGRPQKLRPGMRW